MSEDSSFNIKQKKKEESRSAPDFFGSLGKGMLARENLEILGNSSGLTPLSFGINVHNGKKELYGLTPLHFVAQSPNSKNFAVFAPFAVRVTKEVLE